MGVPDKTDMIIKLWTLRDDPELFVSLREDGYEIKRVMSPNISYIYKFINENFAPETEDSSWADEAIPSILSGNCFICVKENKPVGFMCCEGTAKGFVGPLGVLPEHRGHGIARALYITVAKQMLALGYKYAVAGWIHDGGLKTIGKHTDYLLAEGASEGSYKDMI